MALRSMKVRIGSAFSALLLMAGTVLPATACGPFFTDDVFQFTVHPDLPLRKFAAGQLGLVRGTFARSYLIVAYRFLTEHPLTSAEQSGVVELWDSRLSEFITYGGGDATTKWQEARKKLGGAGKEVDINVTRGVGTRQGYGGFTDSFLNCPDAAFAKATDTLKQMVQKYGAGSEPVKEWMAAQDLVFAHCGDPSFDYNTKKVAPEPNFPKPLTGGDELEKANRNYQIACAHFYAEQFDLASKEFTEIAGDTASPWHEIAPYLAARATLRKATLQGGTNEPAILKSAREQFQKIASSAGNPVQTIADQLLGFIQARLSPEDRIGELADRLQKGDDAATFVTDLSDFTNLYDRLYDSADQDDAAAKKDQDKMPGGLLQNDMVAWIKNMQDTSAGAFATAKNKWQETHSLPWLVAALSKMKGTNYDAVVAAAAEKIPASSPAYWTAMYCAASALSDTANKLGPAGRKSAASITDKMLATTSDAPPSAVNAFKDVRLTIAPDFNTFVSAAIQTPAGSSDYMTGTDIPDDFDKAEKSAGYFHVAPAFSGSGAAFLNSKTPLAVLVQLCSSDKVPAALRLDVCQAAWTRAVLLNDDAAVAKVTPMLLSARPALKKFLDAYTNAKSPEEKKFAAANMLLLNPGMRPLVAVGLGRPSAFNEMDDFRNNWWSPSDLTRSTGQDSIAEDDDTPLGQVKVNDFYTKVEQQTAADQLKTLTKLGNGVDFILVSCTAMARKNPADPRLPEALYRAIRAPKFSDHTSTTTKLSKTAFELMHSQYPKNPWTAKTKYWY